MKASEFLRTLGISEGPTREMLVMNHLLLGNIPEFLWNFMIITSVDDKGNILQYEVMPDYICIGENDDYIHMPATPYAVNQFMDNHDLVLPTKKMVRKIWEESDLRIAPITWTEMYKKAEHKKNRNSTACYLEHSKRIQQVINYSSKDWWTKLRAGHKKDVVLTNELLLESNKGNVAIYGWFNLDGTVIQGLNPSGHIGTYVDYSHGLRMVKNKCFLNGEPTTLHKVWSDPNYFHLASDELLRFMRY